MEIETVMPRKPVIAFLLLCFFATTAHPQATATPSPAPASEQTAAPQPSAPDAQATPQDGPSKGNDDAAGSKAAKPPKGDNDKPLPASQIHNAILWKDPGAISQLDLYYGLGGKKHMPAAPYTFLTENKSGTNPKFDVRDANGKKWRVKLGEEARPEVVASRLLWAVGYYANEDYLLQNADVPALKMSRGHVKGTQIEDARFARKPGGENKIGTWEWKNNPFSGTREFNGLRVMMAVMNNWDLKDVNNAIYQDTKTGQQIFLVSDVGATFATNQLESSRSKDKGNLESYNKSKFILKQTDTAVTFATPAPPTGILAKSLGFRAKEYFDRKGFVWIGQDIPIADVRWVASLLGQLSHQQIADAFRAANFPAAEAEIYVDLVANRIQLLKEL